ncbi:MAG TPA: universal stress protein [Thermoanaerobaculia bacterium]|nr:universal stress protein [Thermoanaerobaculia bacterium]
MSATSLQRILVPTDLSDFAAGAIRWAALLQRRLGGRITVLYANQPYVPFDIMEGPAAYALQTSVEFRDRLARDLRAYVERHLPEAGDAVETRIVDQGAPAQAILETAEAIDADLIVMGTHGRTGWRRALLGSVAEKVVHHTDRAVLCIPPGATPSIGKILCPVNFTEVARVALEEACALAATFDAELLIVHVTDPGDAASDIQGEFAAWIDPHVRTRCRYAHIVASGNAAEETIRLANETHADLIVLGSQHKRFTDASVIGATTERVVRFAKRAVWVVVVAAT